MSKNSISEIKTRQYEKKSEHFCPDFKLRRNCNEKALLKNKIRNKYNIVT